MSAPNTVTALALLTGALEKAMKVGDLLRRCQAEGRSPTPEEVQAFVDEDDAARARLQAAIDAAKTPSGPSAAG